MKELLQMWIYSDGKKSAGKTGATLALTIFLICWGLKLFGISTVDNTTVGIATGALGIVLSTYTASKFTG
jgi:hypothetical protein